MLHYSIFWKHDAKGHFSFPQHELQTTDFVMYQLGIHMKMIHIICVLKSYILQNIYFVLLIIYHLPFLASI